MFLDAEGYTLYRMRPALTMIELIFVIVIVGILGGIAFNKLAAVRDDAKLTTDIAQMATCINDAAAYYTAKGIDMTAGQSDACDNVTCFTITYGSDFIVATNTTADNYCTRVDELGGHLAKTYHFHGTSVSL
jgi:prepilin-type N-terminal cleavage/methylation domain-containing protein